MNLFRHNESETGPVEGQMRRRNLVTATISAIVILGLLRPAAVLVADSNSNAWSTWLLFPATRSRQQWQLLTMPHVRTTSPFRRRQTAGRSRIFSMDAQPLSAAIVIDDAIPRAALKSSGRAVSFIPCGLQKGRRNCVYSDTTMFSGKF
jgi:hypothetical protein